ncbi:MAG: ankyrin repeat domain-containing protein, partial [Candidatus Omnitrophica bacterium]|nr:ankyrin repeat domain-containing protein [Candidatus Omnitrophota bacterium]
MKLLFYLFLGMAVLSHWTPAYAQYAPGNIYSAARGGDIARLKQELETPCPPQTLNALLNAAVAGNQKKIILYLIKQGADPNQRGSWGNPILMNAIMFGHETAALALIQAGAKIHIRGHRNFEHDVEIRRDWTPLMAA